MRFQKHDPKSNAIYYVDENGRSVSPPPDKWQCPECGARFARDDWDDGAEFYSIPRRCNRCRKTVRFLESDLFSGIVVSVEAIEEKEPWESEGDLKSIALEDPEGQLIIMPIPDEEDPADSWRKGKA